MHEYERGHYLDVCASHRVHFCYQLWHRSFILGVVISDWYLFILIALFVCTEVGYYRHDSMRRFVHGMISCLNLCQCLWTVALSPNNAARSHNYDQEVKIVSNARSLLQQSVVSIIKVRQLLELLTIKLPQWMVFLPSWKFAFCLPNTKGTSLEW